MNPETWVASGHVGGFSDPLIDCKSCKARFRADKIIEESKKNDIPQYEDEKLATSLSKLEIGENIPPELYEVVAQVLLFVDKMDRLKSAVAEKRR